MDTRIRPWDTEADFERLDPALRDRRCFPTFDDAKSALGASGRWRVRDGTLLTHSRPIQRLGTMRIESNRGEDYGSASSPTVRAGAISIQLPCSWLVSACSGRWTRTMPGAISPNPQPIAKKVVINW